MRAASVLRVRIRVRFRVRIIVRIRVGVRVRVRVPEDLLTLCERLGFETADLLWKPPEAFQVPPLPLPAPSFSLVLSCVFCFGVLH